MIEGVMAMAFQELIRIRTLKKPDSVLKNEILTLIRNAKQESGDLIGYRILKNVKITTDWAVVLRWRPETYQNRISHLAEKLKGILDQIGQVDQSVWKEIK